MKNKNSEINLAIIGLGYVGLPLVLEFAKNITLRNSDLVSDGTLVFMSNNKNEFFEVDLKTGIIKWKFHMRHKSIYS